MPISSAWAPMGSPTALVEAFPPSASTSPSSPDSPASSTASFSSAAAAAASTAQPPPANQQQARLLPAYTLLVCSDRGDLLVIRTPGASLDLPLTGPLPANSTEDPITHVLAAARTCVHLPALPIHFATIFEESCPAAPCPTFTWVFFCTISSQGWTPPQHCAWVASAELPQVAFTHTCSPLLSRVLRSFCPLLDSLGRVRKATVPSTGTPLWELQDYHVLQPCYYIFDNPGKGVRSKAVQALADVFDIHRDDLEQLKFCVDRFHELSLIVDDIEDFSDRRRDRECAHIRFGVPASLNSAYLLLFKLIHSVPERFRRHHDATLRLLVEGNIQAHRGQGLEIHWRDTKYCPTLPEYMAMVKGKTSTPFTMAARLFFLHSTDFRLHATAWMEPWLGGLNSWVAWTAARTAAVTGLNLTPPALATPQQRILELFELMGVYFQIRDDYINLVDPEYWAVKGFCDDIHERKFSFPVIYMIQNRLGRYQQLLDVYASKHELTRPELQQALEVIQETSTLDYTYGYLQEMQAQLLAQAKALRLTGFIALLERLVIRDPRAYSAKA